VARARRILSITSQEDYPLLRRPAFGRDRSTKEVLTPLALSNFLESRAVAEKACDPVRIHIGDQMTLEEFRMEMESYRRSADSDAKLLKDPYITLERLRDVYMKFDDLERRMADQVFSEWALSEDEGLRFDALALINELKIEAAVPALLALAARLASSAEISAPYELKKVHRILAGL
jgi:hypothetical protein